jgi:tetrahydromethanopterin S-methyltransferase subunit G
MDLENKKLQVDILGKQIDSIKARIDAIHKKLLIFLGVGAGSWFYVIKFGESEIFALNLLAVLFFLAFIFAGLGNFAIILKLSKLEQRLSELEEKLENVR